MSTFQSLSPPLGVVPGCLPRETKVGEICPIFSERFPVIDPEEWDALIATREFRGRDDVHKIKSQGSVGSCSTEATAQCMEVLGERQGYDWVEFNPWSVYRITSGGRDTGSNIDRNLQQVRDVGILPVSYFPRYDERGRIVNRWNARPPSGWEEVARQYRIDEFFDCSSIAEVGTALLMGFPVQVGWSSHAETLIELLPGQKALVANSWGTDWGDNGFHVERLSKINFRYGSWACRTIVDRGL